MPRDVLNPPDERLFIPLRLIADPPRKPPPENPPPLRKPPPPEKPPFPRKPPPPLARKPPPPPPPWKLPALPREPPPPPWKPPPPPPPWEPPPPEPPPRPANAGLGAKARPEKTAHAMRDLTKPILLILRPSLRVRRRTFQSRSLQIKEGPDRVHTVVLCKELRECGKLRKERCTPSAKLSAGRRQFTNRTVLNVSGRAGTSETGCHYSVPVAKFHQGGGFRPGVAARDILERGNPLACSLSPWFGGLRNTARGATRDATFIRFRSSYSQQQ